MITDGAMSLWEAWKGGMITLSTTGILVLVKLMFSLRDLVREHERDINGVNGENGLKRASRAQDDRLDRIEERNLLIDKFKEREQEQYGGEERRHTERRLIDLLTRLDAEPPHGDKP